MKDLKGMERPQFMTLAPNSITKVRVYVYIEGQDVDCTGAEAVDFAISVELAGSTQDVYE